MKEVTKTFKKPHLFSVRFCVTSELQPTSVESLADSCQDGHYIHKTFKSSLEETRLARILTRDSHTLASAHETAYAQSILGLFQWGNRSKQQLPKILKKIPKNSLTLSLVSTCSASVDPFQQLQPLEYSNRFEVPCELHRIPSLYSCFCKGQVRMMGFSPRLLTELEDISKVGQRTGHQLSGPHLNSETWNLAVGKCITSIESSHILTIFRPKRWTHGP